MMVRVCLSVQPRCQSGPRSLGDKWPSCVPGATAYRFWTFCSAACGASIHSFSDLYAGIKRAIPAGIGDQG